MPVFIAKEHNGKIRDIVVAKNYELANAYWQGKGIYANSVGILGENTLNDHPTGVIPVLSTVKRTLTPLGGNASEYIVVEG